MWAGQGQVESGRARDKWEWEWEWARDKWERDRSSQGIGAAERGEMYPGVDSPGASWGCCGGAPRDRDELVPARGQGLISPGTVEPSDIGSPLVTWKSVGNPLSRLRSEG